MPISKTVFGQFEGKPVWLWTLANKHGLQATVTGYGARVVSLLAPDRHGQAADVVLGFDDLDSYTQKPQYFGALVGRVANRIAGARVTIDGVAYNLTPDANGNHMHGGKRNFSRVVWSGAVERRGSEPRLRLSYISDDGEEGYPGFLIVHVWYTLTDDNALKIEYDAASDKDTLVNLTHHGFFNLGGDASGDVLSHRLRIAADAFLAVDRLRIPTGEIRPVDGTPLDFRQVHSVGERIDAQDDQVGPAGGYDHCYVLRSQSGALAEAAEIADPASGRVMQVLTTEPGMQLYSGNNLNGSLAGKRGCAYGKRAGICFETQRYPDAPNHPHFPSILLRAGEHYRQTTVYRFATM